MRFAVAILLLAAAPAFAQQSSPAAPAACEAPAVPVPESFAALPPDPVLPPCAANNRCSKAQIATYNASVDAFNKTVSTFNDRMGAYVSAVNDYATAANRYASCEIDRVNAMIK